MTTRIAPRTISRTPERGPDGYRNQDEETGGEEELAPVLVTVVLDRSGSMGLCRDETIEAFNSYLGGLCADEGETLVQLRQFDHEHEVVFGALPVANAPLLTHTTYQPRGSTALNDAIALGIADADSADVAPATKHLLVVVTDGYENASREHTPESIKALVAEREARGWTVVFLQGNLDLQAAQTVAWNYGVSAGNVAVYDTNLYGSTSSAVTSLNAVTSTVGYASGSSAKAFADAGVAQDYTSTVAPKKPKRGAK